MLAFVNESLRFWHEDVSDPFDPTTWDDPPTTCRIYDTDLIRYATVDAKYFSALITQKDTNPHRTGKLMPRLWRINRPHPGRHGKKEYFVSNAGFRKGPSITFLHVEVMRLAGRKSPSPRHKVVNHEDGDEWNCTEANLK